jgi:hypothetical protein
MHVCELERLVRCRKIRAEDPSPLRR